MYKQRVQKVSKTVLITSYFGTMTPMAKMIGKFDGSDNVVVWLKKFKLVRELQKMADLSLTILLFLKGSVFAL